MLYNLEKVQSIPILAKEEKNQTPPTIQGNSQLSSLLTSIPSSIQILLSNFPQRADCPDSVIVSNHETEVV